MYNMTVGVVMHLTSTKQESTMISGGLQEKGENKHFVGVQQAIKIHKCYV